MSRRQEGISGDTAWSTPEGRPLKDGLDFCPLATMKPHLAPTQMEAPSGLGVGFCLGGVFLDIFIGIIVDSCTVLRNNTKEILHGLYLVFPIVAL